MFQLIGFAVKYVPVILSIISMVEALTDKATPGADKKALVISTLKQTLAQLGVTLTPAMEGLVNVIIDAAVGLLNTLKLFRHKADEPVEEVETPVVPVPAAVVRTAVDANATRLDELEDLFRSE